MNAAIINNTSALSEQHTITSFSQDDIPLSLNANILNASGDLTGEEKVAEAVPKPKDGIYELCNARKDKLRICSQLSIINAFYKCCEYGLDPAASLGQAWLIPYKSTIDLQIGYRGWLKLLFSNPLVSNVYSYGVYKDDFFEYELGMNPNIKHVPSKEKQHKDNLVATYGVVKLKSGEAQIKVCFRDEINESMESSRSSHKPDSPWVTHFEAMALVVPIRKLGKNLGLPLRVEDFDEGLNHEIKNI